MRDNDSVAYPMGRPTRVRAGPHKPNHSSRTGGKPRTGKSVTARLTLILPLAVVAVLLSMWMTGMLPYRRYRVSQDVDALYRSLAGNKYVANCQQKVKQCRTHYRTPQGLPKVCIDHPPTAHHPDRISRHYLPTAFAWDRHCDPGKCGVVFIGAEHAEQSRFWESEYCTILFNLEPPAIIPSFSAIQKFINNADLVLSSTAGSKFSVKDKVFPFIHGSTWILPDQIAVHPKSNLISLIASAKNQTIGHALRHDIVQRYGNQLDVYGHGYNPVQHKETALNSYMYTIVIENSVDDYYFTEKIVDAFLTGTIPVYWGSPVVDQLFNSDGIMSFRDLQDFAEVLKGCTKANYYKRMAAIKENFELAKSFKSPEMVLEKFVLKEIGLIS